MLTPRLTNCAQCEDICSLIESIDCKVAEMSVSLYNNVVFMLNKSFNHEVLSDLLNYKRILQYKVCNPDYAGHFTVNMIASKVRRFTSGCIKDCSCRTSGTGITTTSTSTIPPSTTTTTTITPVTTTTTSTSSSSSTTTTTTVISCCTSVTNLELPGDTILLDGVNLTFSSTQPAGLSIWTNPSALFPACLPSQTLNTVLTGGLSGDTDWDYTINFDQPVNDVKIQVINYSASSVLQIQEQITFTTDTDVAEIINCDGCDVIIESNSIKSVMDTNGSGTFTINANDPYVSLTLTPTMLGVNPEDKAVTVFLRICGLTIAP